MRLLLRGVRRASVEWGRLLVEFRALPKVRTKIDSRLVGAHLRVLLVHPDISIYGGAEEVVIRLASYLTKKGIQNALLTLYVSPNIIEKCGGLQLITYTREFTCNARQTSFLNAVGLISEIFALKKLVSRYANKFDIINVHNFPATWSTFPMHKPCVWMCNELPDLYQNPNPSLSLKILRNTVVEFDKLIVNKCIDSICVSDELSGERVRKRYYRSSEVVNYGIDHDFFSKGDGERFLRKYDLHNGFIIAQVGFVEPQKNQLESVRTIQKLGKNIPNVKLVLAGSNNIHPYGRIVREYVRQNGLQEQVLFTGHLDRETVRDLYHACDVFISPIRVQGGWLSPFEALCASKPIVVSPTMTASTIISREKIGTVTTNFTGAIIDIYNNPSHYQEMAIKGRQFVAENLGWDMYCQRMLAIFEKLIISSDSYR